MRRIVLAASLLLASAPAFAADPIEGNWRTEAGSTAAIAACGGAYCITLRSGKHSGKRIGSMSASGGGKYSGSIIDPDSDKSYAGSATLSGGTLRMSGCVLGGIICRTQTWSRR